MSEHFEDHRIEAGHARKSLRGGAVSVAARAINALIQIGSVLFLARLLTPEDYGLVSMVIAITGFAPLLVDIGTRDAIVQRTRITPGEVSALFWMTIGIACGLAILVASAGPLIAAFYGEPRLRDIALAASLTFIVSALTCQPYALLRRSMRFQELGVIEVAANLLSACAAIAMARIGLGYWALVARPIATNGFLALGVWIQCGWLPGKPTFTSNVKEMVRFGLNVSGFSMTDFTGRSADKVAIGYRSGATALGFYQNALFVYDNLIDVLVFPLHAVAVASLSKLRDDLPELKRSWAKALSTLTFYAMPAFGILAVTSEDLIVFLLGKKWASAGLLLSVLALRGIPHCVERTLGWLHVTAGRTDRWMRWGAFAACVHLVALFVGLPFGPRGVVTAYAICMFGLFVPALAFAGRPLGIGASDVIKAVGHQMIGALCAAGVGFLLRYTMFAEAYGIGRALILATAYLLVYVFTVVGLFKLRDPLHVMMGLLRDLRPRRAAQLVG